MMFLICQIKHQKETDGVCCHTEMFFFFLWVSIDDVIFLLCEIKYQGETESKLQFFNIIYGSFFKVVLRTPWERNKDLLIIYNGS